MPLTEKDPANRPRTPFCVALGGVITSLVMLLMFCATLFPPLDYAIPTYAGFLMVVVIVEAGADWAFMTYISCAVLCPLMTPDYEAAFLFILFMGYYPILFVYLGRIKNKHLRTLTKFAVFNAAILIFAAAVNFLLNVDDMLEGMEMFGKWAGAVMLLMANFFFVMYDYLLDRLIEIYTGWFRKKILRRSSDTYLR